ncbi:hypothetical protein [Winogradskyella marincola]|uniref:Lipoprotein n=1 Tax=Winogradskyella marincola TaxID=3037795 RepID=A0ABT6G1C2_9FLAO|nr:hypothetical protein [Winogradskyella sp. YYF002]MDG4715816.1 hypothetical protein [Winogradskyella sp. YYF002]
MIKKFLLVVFIIFLSCESKISDNEINNFCYEFVYAIHSKDSEKLNSIINKDKLVNNTNDKLKDKNIIVDYDDIITGLFIGHNPLKYGQGYHQKLDGFNIEDLQIIILKNTTHVQKINIKWNNIFNHEQESVIVTVENKKITLIE